MTERTMAAMRRLALALGLVLAVGSGAHAEPKPLSKEEQAKIDNAIDKAVSFLKHVQTKKGYWPPYHEGMVIGESALSALAVLEAGVPVDDPVVLRAAECLRPQLSTLHRTYEISLALLFFDRLGDPQDKAAIRSLALRLIAGQCRTGGWCYRCPTLTQTSEETLSDLLQQWDDAAGKKPLLTLPPALKMLTVFQDPAKLWQEKVPGEYTLFTGQTDNSNTQFALLALWVAQRHGVPLGPTVRLVAQRFENSQKSDGSWSYGYLDGGNRPEPRRRSMTTVGLLGLALRDGLRTEKDLTAAPDSRVVHGLAAVSRDFGDPTGQMKRGLPMTDVYYLWSLERLAMLYDLPTIGGKDWYRWGAEILVGNQNGRGDWAGWDRGPRDAKSNCGPNVNTSFALLFLLRSHLVKDLTAKLPYKSETLEKGIVATLQGRPLPAELARPETPSKKP